MDDNQIRTLLASAIGCMTVWSDSLEEIKQSLERTFGMPNIFDTDQPATWFCEWSNLDHMVCKMREMVDEHNKMLKGGIVKDV